MASEDESQGNDHHHDDREWEAQKENFRKFYIDDNMTRKDAAQRMKDTFGFNATPRQWERRIKQWGFSKYSTREERMQQIAQIGRSVYEVSKPGRRPRALSSNNLHPQEDRNLRRFARREVSRSRSRSRSTSFTNSSRPDFKNEFPGSHPPTFEDLDFSTPFRSQVGHDFDTLDPTQDGHSKQALPIHYVHNQKSSNFEGLEGRDVVFDVDSKEWPQAPSSSATNQYDASSNQVLAGPFISDMLSQNSMQSVPDGNTAFFGGHASSVNFPLGDAQMLPDSRYDFHGMNAHVLGTDALTEPQIYPQSMPNTQALHAADDTDFGSLSFQLDVVDVDSASAQLTIGEDEFPPLAPDPQDFATGTAAFAIDIGGPLQNDIGPLVEEYVRNVQSIAMMHVGSGIDPKLVSEAQFFTSRLAIVLDNFTKSQQRAVQDMRRTCSNLRERNKLLENMLMNPAEIQASMSSTMQPQHQPLPHQSPNYGNIYNQPYSTNLG